MPLACVRRTCWRSASQSDSPVLTSQSCWLPRTTMISSRQYLETSFWNEQPPNESDDDEGIGSDESVDQADHHNQCHCTSHQPAPRTREMSQQTKEPGLSVTKFLRVLKQSVKRDTGLRSAIVQSPTLVFGLDLSDHLAACRTSVPDVVRRVRLSHFV